MNVLYTISASSLRLSSAIALSRVVLDLDVDPIAEGFKRMWCCCWWSSCVPPLDEWWCLVGKWVPSPFGGLLDGSKHKSHQLWSSRSNAFLKFWSCPMLNSLSHTYTHRQTHTHRGWWCTTLLTVGIFHNTIPQHHLLYSRPSQSVRLREV